eukprot:1246603-Amphidinium_carterae.1
MLPFCDSHCFRHFRQDLQSGCEYAHHVAPPLQAVVVKFSSMAGSLLSGECLSDTARLRMLLNFTCTHYCPDVLSTAITSTQAVELNATRCMFRFGARHWVMHDRKPTPWQCWYFTLPAIQLHVRRSIPIHSIAAQHPSGMSYPPCEHRTRNRHLSAYIGLYLQA